MTRKSTKRAMLFSVLSLVLCMSMFVGTTYAWFTDSVTSANNVIQSGNLDLEVEYSTDGETWLPVEEDTALFPEDALWEPGHTEVVAIKVKNVGSLAFKYMASTSVFEEVAGINQEGAEFKLSEHLIMAHSDVQADGIVGDILMGLATSSRPEEIDGTLKGNCGIKFHDLEFNRPIAAPTPSIDPGQAHVFAIAIMMPTTVGNVANHDGEHIPSIKFGFNVMATQMTSESDSFGNDYDADAQWPVVLVLDEESLALAAENGGDVNVMGDVALEKYNGTTIAGSSALVVTKDTVLYGAGSITNNTGYGVALNDADATLTIKSGNYTGKCDAVYVRSGNLVIDGGFFRDVNTDDNGRYLINCYDNALKSGEAKVTITGGTFVNWNPADSSAENPRANFVPAGYKSVAIDKGTETWYVVVEENTEIVTNAAELKELAKNNASGKIEGVVDAAGQDLGDVDYVKFNDGAVLKNATISGASNYGQGAYGTVTFENCNFVATGSYAAHFDNGSADSKIIFKSCTFSGWNAIGSAIKGVEFVDCTFAFNGNYGSVRVYQDASFTDCTFSEDFKWVDTNVNGTVVTFTNCDLPVEKIRNNGSNVGTWIVDGVDISAQITTH